MADANTKNQIANMINSLAPQAGSQPANPTPPAAKPPVAQPIPPAKNQGTPEPTPAPPKPVAPTNPLKGVNPAAYTPEQRKALGIPDPVPAVPATPVTPASPATPAVPGTPAVPATPTVDPAMQMIMNQMAQQQALIAQLQSQVVKPAEEVAKVAAPAVENLLTQDELAAMFKADGTIDAGKMYTALTTLGQRSYQLAREDSMREMPAIVATTAKREAAIASTVSSFWQANSDLSAVRQQVAWEADRVVAANPHLPLEQVLGQAAQTVRTALGSYTQAVQIQNNPAQQAAFVPVNSGGQRVDGADNRSSLQQGIDAMLNSQT